MRWRFAHHTLPRDGETSNGDTVVVRQEDDLTLLAVIDAVGHGPNAAEIANEARRYVEEVPIERAPRDVVLGLHERLRGTRGAAATVCRITGAEVEGSGVGNVEMVATTGLVSCLLTPGILGVRLLAVRQFGGRLATNARFVLFTDGISRRFDVDSLRALATEEACRAIMGTHRKRHDDATVLVADAEMGR